MKTVDDDSKVRNISSGEICSYIRIPVNFQIHSYEKIELIIQHTIFPLNDYDIKGDKSTGTLGPQTKIYKIRIYVTYTKYNKMILCGEII